MSEKLYREEAIPLVTLDSSSKHFVINEAALTILQSIPSPISIVGVAGLYRTGKSYLLNRVLLDRSGGFGVAPTVNACTKGIWMWGKPLKGQTLDGDIVNVIVVDSEGLGAVDQDNNHDCRIFALVLLLSSMFLYNSVGTIDENAINNLSLVVNITKHIQVKSSGEQESTEDYAKYLPSFIWVLRDFALQLINHGGDEISPPEYLENALSPQPGFSDEVENKNRIRRLIQKFFPERDCFTMVRPLTKEDELQNLELKELQSLRPEFIEQVLTLRKKIFNQVRPKTLNGSLLSGEMLVGIMRNYVESINSGAVPNIENAWTYICKDHSRKLFADCFSYYEQRFQSNLNDGWPTSEELLEHIHEELHRECITKFRKEFMGEGVSDYLEELDSRIKDRYLGLRTENRREFEALLSSSMEHYYVQIDDKVKGGEIKGYFEFEKELRKMKTHFMDLEPQGPGKLAMINEFLFQKSSDATHFLIKNSRSELESKISVLEGNRERLEKQLYDIEEQLNRDRNDNAMKIFELESRKSDFETKNKLLNEKLTEIRSEKGELEEELLKQLEKEREESRQKEIMIKEKVMMLEEQKAILEKGTTILKSEHDKEIALLEQKVNYYENGSDQFEKKEVILKTQLDELRKEMQDEVISIKKGYEEKLSDLQKELFFTREKLNEYQTEIEKKEELHLSMCKDIEDKNKTYQNILTEREAKLKDFESKFEEIEKTPAQLEEMKKKMSDEIIKLKEKLKKSEMKSKEKEDKLLQGQANFKKEKALLEQNLSFHEIQVSELKKQLEEVTRFNADAINSIEGLPKRGLDFSKELEEELELVKKKFAQLTEERLREKDFAEKKILQLTERCEQIESELLKDQSQWEEERRDLNLVNEKLSDETSSLKAQIIDLESQRDRDFGDIDTRYQTRIEDLEKELDIIKTKNMEDLKTIQNKGEESLKQLKSFYDTEKKRLEKKLVDEKSKYTRLTEELEEEFQVKLRQERNMYEEQIDSLEQDLKEFEIQQMANGQRFDQEVITKNQRIEHLESTLEETKKNLEKIQESTGVSMKQTMASFENDRKTFLAKIEQQKQELSQKDIEIFQLKQSIESINGNRDRTLLEAQTQARERLEEIGRLKEYLSQAKEKHQKLSDEWLDKENTISKELALSNQKNEFYMKRINELSEQNDAQSKTFEDKLAAKREEILLETKEGMNRVQGERDLMEQRYEAKKRQIKELETEYQSKLGILERSTAVLQEKLTAIEAKKFELEKKLSSDAGSAKDELRREREAYEFEKKSYEKEIEQLKVKHYEIELELVETQANYDKDYALWEGKNKFLEQQKAQLKSELSEHQKNFDILVQKFNQFRAAEKEETETNQSAFVQRLEQRYTGQIQDLKDQHKLKVSELEEKIKRLERDNRKYTEQIMENEQSKNGSNALLERRIRDCMLNEKKYQDELIFAKKEREEKILAIQRKIDEEKEKARLKLFRTENELKDSENRRQMLIYEHEKEKTKWGIENGQLVAQQHDYLEQIDKLKRKIEGLNRENERLVNDVRQAKRGNTTNSLMNWGGRKSEAYMNERSFLKDDKKGGGGGGNNNNEDNLFGPFSGEEK